MTENSAIIQSLRDQGFRIYVRHNRIKREKWVFASSTTQVLEEDDAPDPKGGTTIVELISPTDESFIGVSKCSTKDSYNKKRGLCIALGRALKEMELAWT